MYLNPLYRRFSRIAFLFIIVFNLVFNLNEVHAQKLNLKQKINAIKWPSILQGKKITLDDSLKQQLQPKICYKEHKQ